jgi:integrase
VAKQQPKKSGSKHELAERKPSPKYGRGTLDVQRNGRVRARVPDGQGEKKTLGTYDTRAEAERVLVAYYEEGSRLADADGSIGAYGERAITRMRLAGKDSWKADESRWKIVRKHAEGQVFTIDSVRKGEIKEFLTDLLSIDSERGEPYSTQTVKHVRNLLKAVFAEALDAHLVTVNPVDGIKAPKGKRAADNWVSLSTTEIAQLARCNKLTRMNGDTTPVAWGPDTDALSYEQCVVFLLVIYTGLRQGECAALQWPDVIDLDGESPHLWICKSWNKPYTKSRKDRRVDLIPAAVELLKGWRAHIKGCVSKSIWGHLYAYGYDWDWAVKTELSVPNPVCWLGAKRTAAISRRVTFHHLRDTCASHLLSGTWGFKWTIAEVAELLGHSTTYVTERYARLLPGSNAEIAKQTYRKQAADRPQGLSKSGSVRSSEDRELVEDFGERAMQDSNLRLLAPEANAAPVISITCNDRRPVAACLANELLQMLGSGKVPSEEQLSSLAEELLEQDVLTGKQAKLAVKITRGGPSALSAAIELAGLLRAAESVARPEVAAPTPSHAAVIHSIEVERRRKQLAYARSQKQ